MLVNAGSLPAPVDVLPASVRRRRLRRRRVGRPGAPVGRLRRAASPADPRRPRPSPTPPSAASPRQQVRPIADGGDGVRVPATGGGGVLVLSAALPAVPRGSRQRSDGRRSRPRLRLADGGNSRSTTSLVPGQQTHLVLTESFYQLACHVMERSCYSVHLFSSHLVSSRSSQLTSIYLSELRSYRRRCPQPIRLPGSEN